MARIAYADPPYINNARRHYRSDPRCAEVDHAALIAELETYDGWALSLSRQSLRQVLELCPPDVQIGAWGKRYTFVVRSNQPVTQAWEPVLFRPVPKRKPRGLMTDWIVADPPRHQEHGPHIVGMKPEAFSMWLFGILLARPSDSFSDMFPGSGAMGRAWEKWTLQQRLPLDEPQVPARAVGLWQH